MAASFGDIDTLKVLALVANVKERGFVGFSPKRKNFIKSNVIGAAAWNGNIEVLEYLCTKLSSIDLEFEAKEELDYKIERQGNLTKEVTKYTPLMLAIAKGDDNLAAVKILLKNNAKVTATDDNGNNVLHLAAYYKNNRILDYLCKNVKIDLTTRNSKGETALFISQILKN